MPTGTWALRLTHHITFFFHYHIITMMKKNYLKAIIPMAIALLLTTCNSKSDKAITTMCEELHSRYPLATLQDVYKTCYQDHFGAEHLLSDTASARYYLNKEIQECMAISTDLYTVDTQTVSMPKTEPTGFRHRFTRVNLSCVIDGEMTEEELFSLFLDAASKDNAYDSNWPEEWARIESIAIKVCPSWADPALQTELRDAAINNHPVRHSDAFREAYHPHYRIVRNKD